MTLLYCEQHHIDDLFLDQPVDSRQKWQNLEQMMMFLIIWQKFDPIGTHLPKETRL